jgi:hypothetical protein
MYLIGRNQSCRQCALVYSEHSMQYEEVQQYRTELILVTSQ